VIGLQAFVGPGAQMRALLAEHPAQQDFGIEQGGFRNGGKALDGLRQYGFNAWHAL